MIKRLDDGWIEFAHYRPRARRVQLAGDFNNWQPDRAMMHRDDGGWWRLRLKLEPGDYRFNYLVDDRIWETDFAAFGILNDLRGGWFSMLWVGAGEAVA